MRFKTIIFAGPSAIGKTYIAEKLENEFSEKFEHAKIFTTRAPRNLEVQTDRIFVSTDEFNQMIVDKKFIVYDNFGGNLYGFTKESLYPKDKHLLLNAWPWLVPKFASLGHTVIVGMQAPKQWEKLLRERMVNRGDNEDTIRVRLKLIEKDVVELRKQKLIVEKNGRYFTVVDNSTIHNEILPWIKKELGL